MVYKREEGLRPEDPAPPVDRPEADGALRAGLRPLVLVEPQRLHFNVVVDGDDAAVSGATVLDVCFCPRWYLANIFSLSLSLSLSLWLSLSLSLSLVFCRTAAPR